MSHSHDTAHDEHSEHDVAESIKGYLIGLVLAVVMTVGSFLAAKSSMIWGPGIPIALSVLAVAQMGVHVVYFLHIGNGPDSNNNIVAMSFAVLIVGLLVVGSIWIMVHLNNNMVPMDQLMRMQR